MTDKEKEQKQEEQCWEEPKLTEEEKIREKLMIYLAHLGGRTINGH